MKYLFFVLVLFSSSILYAIGPDTQIPNASEFIIEGKVIDEKTGEGLSGVEIKLLGSDKLIYSDFDGNFSFENVIPGDYSISADYISYKRKIVTGICANGSSSDFTIKLSVIDKSVPAGIKTLAPKA